MKKFLSILLSALVILGLVGCGKANNNTENKITTIDNRVKDEHIEVLEFNKTYEEMTPRERTASVEIVEDYWDDLSDEQKEKYADRKVFITKTKDEAVAKWTAEKKAKMDDEYGHVKVAGDKEEAIKIVKALVIEKLNTKFDDKYDVSVSDSFVNINFSDSVKLSDITKGELTGIARNIYDYFTEAGLARTETEVKKISVYFTIEGKKFTSSWILGKSPEDDWN